jgi:hypothetical protein
VFVDKCALMLSSIRTFIQNGGKYVIGHECFIICNAIAVTENNSPYYKETCSSLFGHRRTING